MKYVKRTLSLDELTGARCVVCGAAAVTSVDLVAPVGVRVPVARGVSRARVCEGCHHEQIAAMRPEEIRVAVALAALPGLLGLVAATLVKLPDVSDGVVTTAAVVLALVFVRRVRDVRAKRAPVLLLDRDAESVDLQVLVREKDPVRKADAYRGVASVAEHDDEEITPSLPAKRWSPSRAIGLLVSAIVVTLAWSGTFASRPATLLIDAPARAVRVAIDGVPFEIAAETHVARTIAAGAHRFDITYLDTNETVHGDLEARAGEGVVLSTDSTQCYSHWRTSRTEKKVHDYGEAFWFEVAKPERGFEHTSCEEPPKSPATWRQPPTREEFERAWTDRTERR